MKKRDCNSGNSTEIRSRDEREVQIVDERGREKGGRLKTRIAY